MTTTQATARSIKAGDTIIFTGPTSTPGRFTERHFVTEANRTGTTVAFETVPESGTNDGFGFYRFTAPANRRLTIEAGEAA